MVHCLQYAQKLSDECCLFRCVLSLWNFAHKFILNFYVRNLVPLKIFLLTNVFPRITFEEMVRFYTFSFVKMSLSAHDPFPISFRSKIDIFVCLSSFKSCHWIYRLWKLKIKLTVLRIMSYSVQACFLDHESYLMCIQHISWSGDQPNAGYTVRSPQASLVIILSTRNLWKVQWTLSSLESNSGPVAW